MARACYARGQRYLVYTIRAAQVRAEACTYRVCVGEIKRLHSRSAPPETLPSRVRAVVPSPWLTLRRKPMWRLHSNFPNSETSKQENTISVALGQPRGQNCDFG